MSISPRSGLLALLVVVPLAACGSEDDGGAIVPADTGAGDTGASAAPTTGTTAAPGPIGTVVDIELVDGEPVGGVQDVEVPRGETVTLHVAADVEDQVHVHGYDILDRIAVGEATLVFVAGVPGQFEVELEGGRTVIANLVVV